MRVAALSLALSAPSASAHAGPIVDVFLRAPQPFVAFVPALDYGLITEIAVIDHNRAFWSELLLRHGWTQSEEESLVSEVQRAVEQVVLWPARGDNR